MPGLLLRWAWWIVSWLADRLALLRWYWKEEEHPERLPLECSVETFLITSLIVAGSIESLAGLGTFNDAPNSRDFTTNQNSKACLLLIFSITNSYGSQGTYLSIEPSKASKQESIPKIN